MNIALLKSKMVLRGDNQVKLANELGITETSLSYKFSGKTPFKSSEMEKIIQRYQLSADEIKEIFFSGGEVCEENHDS